MRIVPPAGVEINPKLRPFVVVDPRAGHGPGIGGFKADSEIGVAFKAGHPCYFVGFLPDPVPGQTIADIARAEAIFIEKVAAEYPEANGKPCVIGNCQAGWAIMALVNFVPAVFVDDEHHFVLMRTMFALLLVVLVVYILAMWPFGSLIARIRSKLRKQSDR